MFCIYMYIDIYILCIVIGALGVCPDSQCREMKWAKGVSPHVMVEDADGGEAKLNISRRCGEYFMSRTCEDLGDADKVDDAQLVQLCKDACGEYACCIRFSHGRPSTICDMVRVSQALEAIRVQAASASRSLSSSSSSPCGSNGRRRRAIPQF